MTSNFEMMTSNKSPPTSAEYAALRGRDNVSSIRIYNHSYVTSIRIYNHSSSNVRLSFVNDRGLDAATAGRGDLQMSELLYADDATTFLALASKLASVSVVQHADCGLMPYLEAAALPSSAWNMTDQQNTKIFPCFQYPNWSCLSSRRQYEEDPTTSLLGSLPIDRFLFQ